MWVQFLGWEDPLEEEMATHSSILAWKISWTEEPGRLQSRGCKELDTTERTEHARKPSRSRQCGWFPTSTPSLPRLEAV